MTPADVPLLLHLYRHPHTGAGCHVQGSCCHYACLRMRVLVWLQTPASPASRLWPAHAAAHPPADRLHQPLLLQGFGSLLLLLKRVLVQGPLLVQYLPPSC
jgi:hypothetical protein